MNMRYVASLYLACISFDALQKERARLSRQLNTPWPCLNSSHPWKLERGDVVDVSRVYVLPFSLTLNSNPLGRHWTHLDSES